MKEYLNWLEKQIDFCANDKDLQREHWAFCKAYEKAAELSNRAEITVEEVNEEAQSLYDVDDIMFIEDFVKGAKFVIEMMKK